MRDLEQPLAADVESKEGASAAALAAAFHQLMLAFVKRDSKLLQELLPATGELTVVNTMEAETGTRELGALRKQLSARKGPLYANLLAGEDDDYADRFAIRATLLGAERGRLSTSWASTPRTSVSSASPTRCRPS